jgi:OFA family oxalate/formate antiporter-like MFS transporter
MNRFINVFSAFIVMLCIGGVYTWSIFAVELRNDYGFSSVQTQIVFGTLIAVFTLSMILGKKIINLLGPHVLGTFSGILFLLGYLLAFFSKGNFFILLTGTGVLGGIATGFGYLVSLTIPVMWFPDKKGMVMGIASAGFGAGAVVLSFTASYFLKTGFNVLQIFLTIGICYGLLIIVVSQFFREPIRIESSTLNKNSGLVKDKNFVRLISGIFTGTFAGLLVIGNLKPIGMQFNLDEAVLVDGIVIFSIANFLGRLFWGWLNDYVRGETLIPLSILIIGLFTLLIGHSQLSAGTYLLLAFGVGFSFGANFVIYAKETAQLYGINNFGKIYPFVFLGYGLSGVFSPLLGGYLYDKFGNYHTAATISFFLCLIVSFALVFLNLLKNNRFNLLFRFK